MRQTKSAHPVNKMMGLVKRLGRGRDAYIFARNMLITSSEVMTPFSLLC